MTKPLKLIIACGGLICFQTAVGQIKTASPTFLLKEPHDSIFIDSSETSKFYDHISDFKFGKFDKDSYDYSLQYLKGKGLRLTKTNLKGVPKKWIVLKYYKKKFYTYHPCDFYSHFKVSIADTAFIDYQGEGPIANKIISYKRIDEKTFLFSLVGVERPKRKLIIHIIDKEQGIAIFEEFYSHKAKQYYLMIDATKIKLLPIIVNYCEIQKQKEVDFEKPDYQRLLNAK